MHHKVLQEPHNCKVLVLMSDIRRCLKMTHEYRQITWLTSKAWRVNDRDSFEIALCLKGVIACGGLRSVSFSLKKSINSNAPLNKVEE